MTRIKRKILNTVYSIENVKKHLRIFSDEDNDYIETLVEMAISYIEDSISYNVQEYKTTVNIDTVYSGEPVLLKRFDRIESVKSEGEDVEYELNGNTIKFNSDLTGVEIIYYESFISFPYLNQCINLIVADWYENRENVSLETVGSKLSYNALSRMLGMWEQAIK